MTTKKTPARKPAAPAAEAPAKSTERRRSISVTTRRDGFRRAGRAWHGTTVVELEVLTDEQEAQIRTEPMLTVEDLG